VEGGEGFRVAGGGGALGEEVLDEVFEVLRGCEVHGCVDCSGRACVPPSLISIRAAHGRASGIECAGTIMHCWNCDWEGYG